MKLSISVPVVGCGSSAAHAAVLRIFAEIHAWLRQHNTDPNDCLVDGPLPGRNSFEVAVELKGEPPKELPIEATEEDLATRLEGHLKEFAGQNQLPPVTIERG